MQNATGQAPDLTPSAAQEPMSKATFRDQGMAIADWASAHGFNRHLVYAVLAGRRKCLRGQSYQIAKELGMK